MRKLKSMDRLVIFILAGCLNLVSFFAYAANDHPTPPLDKVSLQLKWKHGFQFAGYYAAQAQGFYAAEGLHVDILSAKKNTDPINHIKNQTVQYAVGDIGILGHYAKGLPIRALAAIYQHNPLIFISKQSSHIVSAYEMKGKTIMFDQVGGDNAPLHALLHDANLKHQDYIAVLPQFSIEPLINDEVDVMSAYSFSQPFAFKQKNIPINIISPLSYGIDFYGDILFTHEQEVINHPNRVQKFKRASLKGWHYALEHPEEIIQLIQKHYNPKLSLEQLRYAAQHSRKLILNEQIQLGTIDIRRLKELNSLYSSLHLSNPLSDAELDNFIFKSPTIQFTPAEQAWIKANPIINIGLDRDFPPYESFNEQQEFTGIALDFIKKFRTLTGLTFSPNKNKPTWSEVLKAAKSGEIMLLSCVNKTPERTEYLSFTEPYVKSSVIIIQQKLTNNHYTTTLEQLKGKKVALPIGYFTQELLTRDYPEIQLILTENVLEGLRLVATGEADAFIGDANVAHYTIKKGGLLNLGFTGQTPYQSDFRFAISKHHPQLDSIIKKTLNAISQQEKQAIFDHWQALQVKPAGIPFTELFKYIIGATCLLIFFSYWVIRLKQAETARKKSEHQLQAVLNNAPIGIWLNDKAGNYQLVNKTFCEAVGIDEQQFINKPNLTQLLGKEAAENCRRSDKECLSHEQPQTSYETLLFTDHKPHQLQVTKTKLLNKSGELQGIIGISVDVTEKQQADKLIWQQAYYDSLTSLPNRRLFQDRLKQEIINTQRTKQSFALFFMDLDHFKEINDTLGHEQGDHLLIETAQRIQHCLRESDTVARIGGDEFTVILSNLGDIDNINKIATKILHSLALPFLLKNTEHHISSSIGITLYPDDADSLEKLLKNADQAMYYSKEHGRNQFSYFTPAMQTEALRNLEIVNDLHIALKEQQFQLYYQPIIELTTGKILKAEALIRWHHPTKGLINPADFIPIAEDSGLIVPIGDWVFKEAARQVKQWLEFYGYAIQISINKSPIQFQAKFNTAQHWIEHLKTIDLAGKYIAIEITEGLLMGTSDAISQQLLDYSDAGIQVSMDDFGTGYSALAYLKKFDIDYLKIDRSFTQNLTPTSSDMALSEAIIVMAHKLGMEVISEGIETAEQQQLLIKAGCNYGQGYLFSKPMLAEKFASFWQLG